MIYLPYICTLVEYLNAFQLRKNSQLSTYYPPHTGSRISFIQASGADFLLIPPAIAISSGHVSCFPRFILLRLLFRPNAARFALFRIVLVSVSGESRATDQKASGVDSTGAHTIDIATEVHGAATTNHQPPTTTTTCYHYLSAVQTGLLSFSATDSPPFSFIPPSPLPDLTHLHISPITFTDRGTNFKYMIF